MIEERLDNPIVRLFNPVVTLVNPLVRLPSPVVRLMLEVCDDEVPLVVAVAGEELP
jgi:hypothetical protein